jgi:hypothetical protein
MTDVNWEKLAPYLREVEGYYQMVISNPKTLTAVDESLTQSLDCLRSMGLDLNDPVTAYAFAVGIATAYTHGISSVRMRCSVQQCGSAYLAHHGESSGDLGMAVRTILKNLGVDLPA